MPPFLHCFPTRRRTDRRTCPKGKLLSIVEMAVAEAVVARPSMPGKEEADKGAVKGERGQAQADAVEDEREEPGQVLRTRQRGDGG